ncbi:interleukin-1 receptor type 1 isoform X1 [Hemibagrus wyckioides]|uniref:interleukin-1 receptor type 1 isoform X1 n=2 Tax=Hemibagrus wyckioides TaxID=337641 RepID=UPI00266D98A9|nr:interleukin-1 receptor type 1 isoform X1 [Hemibagrus wyckioides]
MYLDTPNDMVVGFMVLWTLAWSVSVSVSSHNETAGLDEGVCKDHGVAFDHVFAVPHEAALLDCELVKDYLFDLLNIPYNVTWYDQQSGREFTGEENHAVLRGSSLLFLNTHVELQGHYLCIVRTPDQCYKQERVLLVEEEVLGACRRSRAAVQRMQCHSNDNLRCPVSDYTSVVDSYSIQWYKGCEPLLKGSRFHFTENNLMLHARQVSLDDAGFYTCRMTFNLTGVIGVVAETIECEIIESLLKQLQMLEPNNGTMKVSAGSPINKTCRVFLPTNGVHMTVVVWEFKDDYVSSNTSDRIHQGPQAELEVAEGWWLERSLFVSRAEPGDLNLNFTCRAFSHRGHAVGYFTLYPEDMVVGFMVLWTLAWSISVSVSSHNETAALDEGVCKDHGVAFDRVFAVPHEAALLDCELVKDYLFDLLNIPYNVTWYDQQSGREFTGEENHAVLRGSSLLFLNTHVELQGHYLCIVRTPDQCYKQERVLLVEEEVLGACRRSRAAVQRMQCHSNDNLRCPVSDYTSVVDSYSIQWYKGCEPLLKGSRFHFTENNLMLHARQVSLDDAGFYTCRMTFNLTGVIGVVAETIECEIIESLLKRPQMLEPNNGTMKVSAGSPINKTCRVFLPTNGVHMTVVVWEFKDDYVSSNTSDRIHQGPQAELEVAEGWWLERSLFVSRAEPGDLNLNFTCRAFSHRGHAVGYFTLYPEDPNLLLPIGLLATTMALLFIMGLLLYRVFKVELVLLFRTVFPFFYASTDGDGKLYDAYVVYPRGQGDTLSEAVETFVLKTLPQVLEEYYGYRLFILGRDSLPGQAVADVVDETMNLCRCLLLLYTSTSLSRTDGSSWFEQQAGLHRALLDDSLSVMLLEMEQLSDPSILPESLRLLRDKQGALQAWKRRRRWMCTRTEEDGEEDQTPLSLFTLSARFWRKVRYYMPVRGKAKRHSKRKLLLNL